ncbi:MAG TPA: aminotransferase class I/II-fold pyridoxal phosphate-dependent enzyme [Dehalococcoidia bacterium]|nr:aminotransferase class I/II-fold pyridoxal phosphate-dependent enzyme [Dehalococcoidia bacterium]
MVKELEIREALGEEREAADVFDKCHSYNRSDAAEAVGIFPFFIPLSSEIGTTALVHGKRVLMFGSNNYLGLTEDQRVRQAAIEAIDRFGTGCTGSRLLNGTIDMHEEVEQRLASFLGRDSAVVFTTGFQTNLGVVSTLVGRHDYVVVDSATHASIRDGSRLSYGKELKFRHNDMGDLERTLSSIPGGKGILIVVDGVYSMEGDLANLPEIVELKQRYGARLVVDDAHGIGVVGANGRGTAEHYGLEHEVDLITGTFSKSLASVGGFVAGDAKIIRFIKHTARSFMFAASCPPPSIAAAMKALDIVESEPQLRENVWANADRMRKGLNKLGFDTGVSQTPIIPMVIGSEMSMGVFWHALLEAGVYTNAVTSPAVPMGHALIRTSTTAAHTPEQVDQALEIMGRVGRAQELI